MFAEADKYLLFTDLHTPGSTPDGPVLCASNSLVGPDSHVVGFALRQTSDDSVNGGGACNAHGFIARLESLIRAVLNLIAVSLGVLAPLHGHLLRSTVSRGRNRRP